MQFDLGLQAIGILLALSLAFALVAQLVFWTTATHWLWLVAGLAFLAGGVFASEVMMGKEKTEENIQPLIDGLAFDEALLGGLLVGLVAVAVTWLATRRSQRGSVAS